MYAAKYKLDILHCTANTAPVFCSVPIMITLHDVIFMEKAFLQAKSGSMYQRLGKWYRRYIVPTAVRKSAYLTTVSHYEKEQITRTFPQKSQQLAVIYNGFSQHFCQSIAPAELTLALQKYKLPSAYILFLGTTDPKKNTKATLQAYSLYHKQFKNPLPLVVADLEESHIMGILSEINATDIRKDIIKAGYIPNADLRYVYAGAKVFLYPSLRESFGIPLLEAMACGTPVITSQTSALPEVAGEAALLANPNDVADIAQAISKMMLDESFRQTCIEKGYLNTQRFSWSKSATALLSLYKHICKP